MTKVRLSFFCVKPFLCLRAGLMVAVLLALLFQAGRFHAAQSLSLSGSGANPLKPATLRKGDVTLPLVEEPAVPHLLAMMLPKI